MIWTLVIGAWSALVSLPQGGDLVLEVINIKNQQGTLIVCLSRDRETFLSDCFIDLSSEHIQNDTVRLIFSDVPYGTFAISLFQDENENRLLDKRAFGIPTEPFGFSNNPRLFFGPPSFSKCAFQFSEESKHVMIKLKHF